ncbi:MAG TPA: zinc ribbon domain-containing protein, partial [Blastocatellia bacterium]|nr:zinc ribbon domain-containing protein [Blastocatellia bacterium]
AYVQTSPLGLAGYVPRRPAVPPSGVFVTRPGPAPGPGLGPNPEPPPIRTDGVPGSSGLWVSPTVAPPAPTVASPVPVAIQPGLMTGLDSSASLAGGGSSEPAGLEAIGLESTGPEPRRPGTCDSCGAELTEGARFCHACGRRTGLKQESPNG